MKPHDKKYWREYAACKGMDTNLFFPEKGYSTDTVQSAKKICNGCSVREECLDFIMNQPDDRYGIFGGYTYTQRRVIRRLMKTNPSIMLMDMIEVDKITKGMK